MPNPTPSARRSVGPLALLWVLAAAGCGESLPEEPWVVRRLEVAPRAVSLAVGDSVQLTARAYNRRGDVVSPLKARVRWASQAAPVARVDPESGWVVAGTPGQTTVTATAPGLAEAATVRVVATAGR
jgi:hypothetical protein